MDFMHMVTRKIILFLTSICICIQLTGRTSHVIIGKLQFPSTVEITEAVPIHYNGHIIPSIVDKESHSISFDIPCGAEQRTSFTVIITEKPPIPALKESNQYGFSATIFDHWKTCEESLMIELSPIEQEDEEGIVVHSWHWKKKIVAAKEPIADDAIIIILNPSYFQTIKGGSEFEFPVFIMKQELDNRVQLAFQEAQIRALDLNSFHAPIQYVVKESTRSNKNIVVLPVT